MQSYISAEKNVPFKKEYIGNINQFIYQSENLVTGKIIKITHDKIYFDVGLKYSVIVKKKSFITNFFPIAKIINYTKSARKSLTLKEFLTDIRVGKNFKFIIFEVLARNNNIILIDFEKTSEYMNINKLFYELDFLKKSKTIVKGYILNAVNGGFSVSLGGLVAFVPNNEFLLDQFTNANELLKINRTFINSSMYFRIININYNRKNVVLTRIK